MALVANAGPEGCKSTEKPIIMIPSTYVRGLLHIDSAGRGAAQSSLAWRRYWYTVSLLIP